MRWITGSGTFTRALKHMAIPMNKHQYGSVLHSMGGDKGKAAETLKVNLSTLYRKLSDD